MSFMVFRGEWLENSHICMFLDFSDTFKVEYTEYHNFSCCIPREPVVLRLLLNKAIFGLMLWLKEEESKQHKRQKGKVVTTLSLCV